MDITLNPSINGSYLFKGISGRADIDRVAQTLSTGVAERFEASAQTELEAPVAALQSKFAAQGLTPAQTASALFLSGALLGGSLGPITARAAREALTQPQVADNVADQATALVKNQHSDTLDTVAMAFADAPVGLLLAGALREETVTRELADWATSPSNPQSGLACGSFLRPDPLFSGRTQLVVNTFKSPGNPDGLEEVAAGKANIINIRQLFSGNDEMAIGFGKPNVFTVIPGAKGKYEKLDAFMFFRKKARVASAEVVQSGVFIRPRNLPPDAIPAFRDAMQTVLDKRSMSCARANAKALDAAGFTSGGKSLKRQYRPFHLFLQIAKNGLEYKGQKLQLDIINTTGQTIENHFWDVHDKEVSSPVRAVKKTCGGEEGSGSDLSGVKQALKLAPVADPTSASPTGPLVHLRNSRPSALVAPLRRLWNAHVLWEALPDNSRVNINNYLPDTLVDKFTVEKAAGREMSLVDKAKSLAFSRPMIAGLRAGLAATFDDAGAYSADQLGAMLRTPGPGEEIEPDAQGRILYNFVICGDKSENRVTIARLDVGKKAPDWVMAKHVLISGYDDDVRCAGECWGERIVKSDGKPGIRLHINNNSGTYRPTDAQIKSAAKYLAALFDCEVVCHPVGEEPASLKTDDQKTYEVPAAKFDALKASLHGQRFTLKDAQGNPQEFVARRFGSRTLDTEYFDTPQRDLLQGDGMLRARSTIKDGEVKEVEVESKVRDAQGTTWRAKGQRADSAKWDTKRAKVLGVGSADPAVVHARTVTGLSSSFQPTAWKNVERELFLVSPTGLFGRLKPSFVISLDTNSVRDTAAGPGGPKYHSVDPQIFTKVPWMKEIDEDRKAQFGDLCAQLSGQNGLTEVTQTAYQETMEHLKTQQGK